ncbi:MAG: hypothetical protein ACK4TB_14850, partial [Gemmobacter sp.]
MTTRHAMIALALLALGLPGCARLGLGPAARGAAVDVAAAGADTPRPLARPGGVVRAAARPAAFGGAAARSPGARDSTSAGGRAAAVA